MLHLEADTCPNQTVIKTFTEAVESHGRGNNISHHLQRWVERSVKINKYTIS